jgi:CheY-like chemotaxis protein
VEGELALAAWRDGHEVVIQVKDSGAGIAAELLPHVFDLFVQGPRDADRAQGGLGLGLTLVRSLVQLHGGTVVALSDGLGKGSAFVVRLPSGGDGPGDTQPGLGRAPRKAASPRRILLVDDNADAASLMAELFLTLGHEVVVAHDGPQALAALAGFTPEVAVLDIGLPVMDGYELARRIREIVGPDCRLIALTGYGQEHDFRRSEAAGFAEHLVKPVDPQRVLRAVCP